MLHAFYMQQTRKGRHDWLFELRWDFEVTQHVTDQNVKGCLRSLALMHGVSQLLQN